MELNRRILQLFNQNIGEIVDRSLLDFQLQELLHYAFESLVRTDVTAISNGIEQSIEYMKNRFEQLLEEEEHQNLIGSLFPTATMIVESSLIILHALLPQKIKIDIKITIETIEEMMGVSY